MIRAGASPNRERLLRTARRIAPLLPDLVFVGGQVVELLVTDPAAVRTRPTDAVDVVVPATSRAAYHRLQLHLRELGFSPDSRAGAPICRLRTTDDLVLDVLPLDEEILGFTNRWYPLTIETALPVSLAPDVVIRAADAPAFLATKWEAFRGRGIADPLTSHDLEDVITLVAGRPSVVAEVAAAAPEARTFVGEATRDFLAGPWAEEIGAGSLPDARRLPGFTDVVLARLRALARG
jgi:hypothetical protein